MTTPKKSLSERQAARNRARKDGTSGRQRLSYDERRAQFVTAARDVFIARGLEGARTREIADQLGVTDALIYNYFSSKTELFEAAVLEPLEGLLNDLLAAGSNFAEIDTPRRVESSHRAHRDMLAAMQEITPLLIVALSADQAEHGSFFQSRIAPLLDRFTAGLESNLAGWPHPNIAPRLLARILLGTYFWTAIDSRFRGEELDIPKVADEVADFFVRGMTGPPDADGQSRANRTRPRG